MKHFNWIFILGLFVGLIAATSFGLACDDDDDDDDDDGNSRGDCEDIISAMVDCGASQYIDDFDWDEYVEECIDASKSEFDCGVDCYEDYEKDDDCVDFIYCIDDCVD